MNPGLEEFMDSSNMIYSEKSAQMVSSFTQIWVNCDVKIGMNLALSTNYGNLRCTYVTLAYHLYLTVQCLLQPYY